MRKTIILALPLAFLVAGEAAAQRALTPGEFFSGLTESGAEVLAAQSREAFPGAMVETSFDIGLGTWTVDVRESNSADN
jgi:hypothetical protein